MANTTAPVTTVTTPEAAGSSYAVENSTAGNDTSLVSSNTSSFFSTVTELLNTTLASNTTWTEDTGSTSHTSLKDHTAFVTLIVMGIIVPAIFITVIILICRQRRKDWLARRTQMLLQNTQDFVLEDYTTMDKAPTPPPRI